MSMRLTLRTMLAYMEDVLEPTDAQDLGKKIEDSEFATSLTHRIRDVTRRLRLAAPKLEGKGIGLDPNSVAEYLDNTLPSERVADLEKVCLESDVHLAEVACCHQILALILGEPAEIDPAMRDRMYKVAHKPAIPTAEAVAAPPVSIAAPPVEGAEEKTPRQKPEVPDYLRESTGSSARTWLATAAVLLVLVASGVVVSIQLGYLPGMHPTIVAQAPAPTITSPATVEPSPPVAMPEQPPAAVPPPAQGLQPPAAVPGVNPAMPPKSITAAVPNPGFGPPAIPPTPQNPPAAVPGQIPPPPLSQPPSVLTNTPAPAATPAGPPAVPPTPATQTAARAPTTMPTVEPVKPAVPRVATKPAAPEVTSTAPAKIGLFMSEHEVLLRFDANTQVWKRMLARTAVSPGDRLVSLPSYRSNLTLGPALSLQMLGGTSADLLQPDSADVPGVRLVDGRLLILPLGKPGAVLHLKVAERDAHIVFSDADATLAMEVSHQRIDGTNPEKEPAAVILDVYATAGEVHWADGMNAQPDVLKAPAHRVLADAPPGPAAPEFTSQDFPSWIKKPDERTPIEKRASEAIDEFLQPDRPITLGLKELATDRRVEVSSLAVQCLAEIDEFDSFVTSLNDSQQRLNWNSQIDSLRRAIARSPETATLVREAFEHHRGPKGTELYRMLWGYSPEQLQSGAGDQLVKYLNHEDLDFRVLSFWNLSRIAGATHFYRPEFTAAKRATAVRAWKQKVDTGQLISKPPEVKP